jgi:hypothetical protein
VICLARHSQEVFERVSASFSLHGLSNGAFGQ